MLKCIDACMSRCKNTVFKIYTYSTVYCTLNNTQQSLYTVLITVCSISVYFNSHLIQSFIAHSPLPNYILLYSVTRNPTGPPTKTFFDQTYHILFIQLWFTYNIFVNFFAIDLQYWLRAHQSSV